MKFAENLTSSTGDVTFSPEAFSAFLSLNHMLAVWTSRLRRLKEMPQFLENDALC